jgi:PHD/YefM family antitoxin component YafN of YafNO toxin-antitoxin module
MITVNTRGYAMMQLHEPKHVDEPSGNQGYADIVTHVAADRQPVVVRRGGSDVAVIIPMELLEMLQDVIAREEAERISRTVNWKGLAKTSPPPPGWFNREEPKPF